jgi:hypothetical protein
VGENGNNSWDVSYSVISFFEGVLRGHARVRSVERRDDIYFVIGRKAELSTVRVLLVDEYTLGLAAVLKAIREFPKLDCVVTASNWNGYTQEARSYGDKAGIGVYVGREFLGALWRANVVGYTMKDARGKPIHQYRSA